MGRFLGIDYGTQRVGIAVSDEEAIISFPLCMLENRGPRQVVEAVVRVAKEKEVSSIVVGMPLNLNGSKGPAAENVERFIAAIKALLDLPVIAWDERLTTRIAERAMIDGGLRRERRRECIDRATAQIILQSYLDAHTRQDVSGSEDQGPGSEDNQDQA